MHNAGVSPVPMFVTNLFIFVGKTGLGNVISYINADQVFFKVSIKNTFLKKGRIVQRHNAGAWRDPVTGFVAAFILIKCA